MTHIEIAKAIKDANYDCTAIKCKDCPFQALNCGYGSSIHKHKNEVDYYIKYGFNSYSNTGKLHQAKELLKECLECIDSDIFNETTTKITNFLSK